MNFADLSPKVNNVLEDSDRSRAKKDELSPAGALCTLLFFIFIYLVTHEVPIQESLQLCGTFLLDLITGSMLWILISRKSIYKLEELFGVGVILGSTIPAIIGLITRGSVIYSTSSYLFSALILITFVYTKNTKNLAANLTRTSAKSVLSICALALLLISGNAPYQWTGVISLVSCVFLVSFAEKKQFQFPKKTIFLIAINGVILISLSIMSRIEFWLYGKRTTTSYINAWDGASLPARSKGLLNNGPFDNLWQSNLKFAYYWFADAWSGSLTSRSRASDWTVTTQFGYIILALATICLILTVIKSKIPQNFLSFVATAFVASTTMIGSASFLFDFGSFSHTVSVTWFLLITFLVNEYFTERSYRSLPVLFYVILIVVMTKTTIAAPVVVGLLMTSLYLFSFKPRNRKNQLFFLTVILSSLSSVGLYYIFIRPEPVNKPVSLDYKIGLVTEHFGISTNIVALDILLLAFYKLIPLIWLIKSARFTPKRFEITLLLIAIFSVSSSLLIRMNSSVGNTYFITPFLILISLLTAIEICKNLSTVEPIEEPLKKLAITALIVGLGSGLSATLGLQHYNFLFFFKTSNQILLLSLPLITGLLFAIYTVLFYRRLNFSSLNILLLFSIVIASSMSGSYVAQSLRSIQQERLNSSRGWVSDFEDVEAELERLQTATKFIVNKLTFKDVLASNSTTENGLLASLTGIRSYGTSYGAVWGGEEHRYNDQTQFALYPNLSNYKALRNGCVTWFYYDKEDMLGEAKSFSPYAANMYEDEFGAVLKLSESYPIPKEC